MLSGKKKQPAKDTEETLHTVRVTWGNSSYSAPLWSTPCTSASPSCHSCACSSECLRTHGQAQSSPSCPWLRAFSQSRMDTDVLTTLHPRRPQCTNPQYTCAPHAQHQSSISCPATWGLPPPPPHPHNRSMPHTHKTPQQEPDMPQDIGFTPPPHTPTTGARHASRCPQLMHVPDM